MTEIAIKKVVFPSLCKFLNRRRIFDVYAYRSHTYVAFFVDIEKRGIMQRRFLGRSSVGGKGKNCKAVFVCYPKHWRYLCLSVGYAQTTHKIQLPLLCFGVPYYRTFFARIDMQNVGRQNSFWL